MDAKKDSEAVRQARVRQLWEARPLEERTAETGTLNFYKWLEEHYAELVPSGQGDPYQRLRAELIQENAKEGKETETK